MIFKVFDNLVPGGWAEFQEWSVGECIWNTSPFFPDTARTLLFMILTVASIRGCGRE